MEKPTNATCNPKGLLKGPLANIEDGLEQSVSEQTKERISNLLERIESLSDVEKLLLYLKLPTGAATEDVLRQTPTSCLYASNRLEQAQAFTWIRSHLEEDTQICVPKHEVFYDYRTYCESHGLKPLCAADFGKVLKCIFPNVKPRRLGQRGQSKYCYSGLRKKLDIQPPSLPELEISPKKPKTEELQESEMFSASCQLVCEWAGKLLSRGFSHLRELAEFLVGNLYVNSKSTAAFTVLAAMQEAGLSNSSVPVSPLFTSSSGGDKHRETQLQLQRKLQERELLREQKKKVQQQRNEIQQEQLRSISRGPSTTPTKSPVPHAFSKTPTPIRSPLLRPSSSLKSPGPTVTFGPTPTLASSVQKPTKCVSRNITKLLQSPVQAGKAGASSHSIKMEETEVTGTEMTAAKVSAAEAETMSGESSSSFRTAEGGDEAAGSGEFGSKPALRVSTVDRNLLDRSNHQVIISGSQGLIIDHDLFPGSVATSSASAFKNSMHVVQKPVVVSAGSGQGPSQQAASATPLQPGSLASSMPSLPGSVGSYASAVGGFSASIGNLCGSIGNLSSSSSSASSYDSVHLGQTITIVSKVKDPSSEQSFGDIESMAPQSEKNYLSGNLSTRSAFVPVSNQKIALTLMAPSHSSMSESSSDESKDQEELPLPMDQSEALCSSGGFQPQPDTKADSASTTMSMQHVDVSATGGLTSMPTPSPQSRGQRKAKNRFTPIRPKAPQPPLPPTASIKDPKTPEKDSRPVSALLKEKRAREAQEVLQHLASSFQHQSSSGKAFPSSLSLPAEVLGLSPDKGAGGKEVVIILTSPSAGNSKASTSSRDLHIGEEKVTHEKPGSVARSMSDILIANPNFFQKKEVMPATLSHQLMSASSQSVAQSVMREKVTVASASMHPKTTVVASHGRMQDSGCENWELSTAADQEVTQHMTNARLLLPESRGADTPNTRKRKSSGQGSSSSNNKRLNSTTEERKLELEDDEVFIVDAPAATSQSKLLMQGQRLVRQVLTEATGRMVRRRDAISPYLRPGSSSLVDMQVDEPVSRCQSTGVGMDKTTYSAATSWVAAELSRQSSGKLNVESLESDALTDTDFAPPAPVQGRLLRKSPVSHQLPLSQPAPPSTSQRTRSKDLAAVQQALLQEKQRLDARFDSIWNKLQNPDMATSPPLSYDLVSQTAQNQQDSADGMVDCPPAFVRQKMKSSVHTQLVQVHPGTQSQRGEQTSRSTHVYQGFEDASQDPQSVELNPNSHSVQNLHNSQSVQIIPRNQLVQIKTTNQSEQAYTDTQIEQLVPRSQSDFEQSSAHSVSVQLKGSTEHMDNARPTVQTVSSQNSAWQPTPRLFTKPANNKFASLQQSSPVVVPPSSRQQDASMNVDTFSVDPNHFLSLVQGIVSEQTKLSMAAAAAKASHAQKGHQSGMLKTQSPPSLTSSSQSAAVDKSAVLLGQHTLTPRSLAQSTPVLTISSKDTFPSKAITTAPKSKATYSHPPPPNTLLALLQSPALSAISPPISGHATPSMRKFSLDKQTLSMSSTQKQAGIVTQLNVPQSVADSLSVHKIPSPSVPVTVLSSQQAVSDTSGPSRDQALYTGLGQLLAKSQSSLQPRSSLRQEAEPRPMARQVPSHLDDSFLPDSMRTLEPVPASLPANFLEPDPSTELQGELPLDVADFVTEHSLKAQQQQQLLQQQLLQQQLLLQQQGEPQLLESELETLLLQQNAGSMLAGCGQVEEKTGVVSGLSMAASDEMDVPDSSTSSLRETFPVPSNPAPKQRLSESAVLGTKKYPTVQRSSSLTGLIVRGLASKPVPQDVPPSPSPSPTRELTHSNLVTVNPGMVSMRHSRHSADSASSSKTSSDEYASLDTSPLMSVSLALSTPSQEPQTVGLISMRRNPLLSTGSDSGHSAVSETMVSLAQVTSGQGGLSNPGSVSAISPSDSVTSPITFMPIQMSPSSSANCKPVISVSQQQYIPPIKPVVTVASMAMAGQEADAGSTVLLSRTHREEAEEFLSLSELGKEGTVAQRLITVDGLTSRIVLASSCIDTSPASSVSSVKSEPGSSASRLMSVSPRPGTVPYNVPSPWGQAAGVSPGPSPTPATSNACSPSSSSSGHRGSAGQGVLQQLLSTRSAPPSYAESVQLRLQAGGQLAGSQVIGGSKEQRQTTAASLGSGSTVASDKGVRARSGSTQSRISTPQISTGNSHSDRTADRRGSIIGSEDTIISSARSVVHHVPSTTSSTPTPSITSTGRERSGRRIPILKREKGRSSASSATSTPKVAAAASDAILKGSLASPAASLDSTDPARPFSQKLQFLTQHRLQLEGGQGNMAGKPLQVASPPSLAVLTSSVPPESSSADDAIKVAPSPGSVSRRARSGGSTSSLGPPIASPATPASPASAPSPSSQGQGQVMTPLRVSTNVSSPGDVFISMPASFPSHRLLHPFSPQQSSSSASSSPSVSLSNVSQGSLYQSFNLPDMNYMGNAPNIDLSQLMEAKAGTAPSQPTATATASQHSSTLQGLDDLQSTLEILQGMDGHYFNAHQADNEDLMHSVFGDLAQDLHVPGAASSQDEEEEGEETISGTAPSHM